MYDVAVYVSCHVPDGIGPCGYGLTSHPARGLGVPCKRAAGVDDITEDQGFLRRRGDRQQGDIDRSGCVDLLRTYWAHYRPGAHEDGHY